MNAAEVQPLVESLYEEAQRELESLMRIYLRASQAESVEDGRIIDAHDREPLEYLFLPHMVAVMEKFSQTSLLQLVEAINPATGFVLEQLWEEAAQDALKTWRNSTRRWASWFAVDLTSFEDSLHDTHATWHDDLKIIIYIRNTIMHGRGFLTRSQRDDNNYSNRLRSWGLLEDANDRIELGVANLQSFEKTIDSFMFWLSEEASEKAADKCNGDFEP